MRVALVAIILLIAGCIGSESPPGGKPDDAKMDSLFTDIINGSGDSGTDPGSVATVSTTVQYIATTSSVSQTTQSTGSTRTTTTLVRDTECSKIEHPLGPSDCIRGYCASEEYYCRYLPGNLNSGQGKCICSVRKN